MSNATKIVPEVDAPSEFPPLGPYEVLSEPEQEFRARQLVKRRAKQNAYNKAKEMYDAKRMAREGSAEAEVAPGDAGGAAPAAANPRALGERANAIVDGAVRRAARGRSKGTA